MCNQTRGWDEYKLNMRDFWISTPVGFKVDKRNSGRDCKLQNVDKKLGWNTKPVRDI